MAASSAGTRASHLSPLTVLLAVALGVLALMAGIQNASGNGASFEIYEGRAGAYAIIVGVLPEDTAVGAVHFSVTISDAETSRPITDAEVTLVAVNDSGQEVYQARAVNTPVQPVYYDANITFESAGAWTIRVDVESRDLGQASVDVPLEVREPALTPGAAGTLLFLAVIAVLVGGGIYVWRASKRALRDRDTK